jgi:hypothetical protein
MRRRQQGIIKVRAGVGFRVEELGCKYESERSGFRVFGLGLGSGFRIMVCDSGI